VETVTGASLPGASWLREFGSRLACVHAACVVVIASSVAARRLLATSVSGLACLQAVRLLVTASSVPLPAH